MKGAEFADCVSHASCKNKLDVNTNRNIREMEGGGVNICLYRQINVFVHEHAFIYNIYICTNIALSGKIQNRVEAY